MPARSTVNRTTAVNGPEVWEFASPEQRAAWKHGPTPLCLSGGFGCVAGATLLYDAALDAHIPVAEITWEPTVLAWTGVGYVRQKASKPFLKGQAELFRVTTARGREITVTADHLFATPEGWLSLRALGGGLGSWLLGCDGDRLPTILGTSLLARASDVPRSWRTAQGSPESCSPSLRRDDGLPLWVSSIDPTSSPSQGDVPERSLSCLHMDGHSSSPECSRAYLQLDRHSRSDSQIRVAPLVGLEALSTSEELDVLALSELEDSNAFGSLPNQDLVYRAFQSVGGKVGECFEGGLAYGDPITKVEALGVGDFYDLHVPVYNNYLAEGLIHHNSGKSVIACRKILRLMDAFPGFRVVVARRRWVHLQKTTMATFFKVCRPEMYAEGRRSDSEKILRLNNGSEVLWMHLEDSEEVANIIPGLEINALFIDQAEEVDEEIYDRLCSRLGRWDRVTVPQIIIDNEKSQGRDWKWFNQRGEVIPPAYAIIACNPDNEMHWIYRRFHPDSAEHFEKKIPEYGVAKTGETPKPTGNLLSYNDLGYKMITMSSTSNKFLTKQNISALLANDESFIKRYVRGEWGSPEGTIHIVTNHSVIPGSQELVDYLTRTCKLLRVMDYGDSAPTAVGWAAVNTEGDVIFYREYYQPDRLISEHRLAIDQLSRDADGIKERYTFQLADPSIFNKMPQAKGGRWCVASEYCLAPTTKILKADMTHVPVSALKVGDVLAGFDEEGRGKTGKDRGWKTSVVTGTRRVVHRSYRITLSDGTSIVCSGDHKWLSNPCGGWRRWMKTSELRVGHNLLRATEVWQTENTYEAGYLAAALDGEGHLSQKSNAYRLGFAQRSNPMLKYVLKLLADRGVTFGVGMNGTHSNVFNLNIGHRDEIMRVIGTVRPKRLLAAFDLNDWGRVHAISKPTIVSIEDVGFTELIELQTSTKTCVAEGLLSHNCDVKQNPETAIFWQPADNNEMSTRNRINEYLKIDPKHRNPFTKELGAPRLYFLSRTVDYPLGCHQILRQLRSQRRERLGTDMGKPIFSDERDEKVTDHAYDLVRYAIASRPPAPTEAKMAAHPNSFNQVRLRALEFHKRNRRVA